MEGDSQLLGDKWRWSLTTKMSTPNICWSMKWYLSKSLYSNMSWACQSPFCTAYFSLSVHVMLMKNKLLFLKKAIDPRGYKIISKCTLLLSMREVLAVATTYKPWLPINWTGALWLSILKLASASSFKTYSSIDVETDPPIRNWGRAVKQNISFCLVSLHLVVVTWSRRRKMTVSFEREPGDVIRPRFEGGCNLSLSFLPLLPL